uniref:Uncharacterized protein n=1 Tax=Oryza barthii TaxID=65489 RepID=A0A0D3FHP2_9ORYZ
MVARGGAWRRGRRGPWRCGRRHEGQFGGVAGGGDVVDYRVAVDVRVLVWVMCRRWLKPCRAFGRFDDDDAVGTVSLLEGVVMALSHLPHKSPGVNIAPASDERRWRYASCSPWGRRFGEPLGSTSFCGGRHTLRLLLRIKLELLAVGVLRRLATMTCCSLFQKVGAGYVKEVALWWLG